MKIFGGAYNNQFKTLPKKNNSKQLIDEEYILYMS